MQAGKSPQAQPNSLEDRLLEAIRDSLRDAVKTKLSGYESPIDPLIASVVDKHKAAIQGMLDRALSAVLGGEDFRQQMEDAAKAKIAKVLIDKFGGEIEKRVNDLKSDPATRAKITLAIETIVKGGAA